MTTTLPSRVDVTQYAGKETLIRLIRQEFKDCFDLLVEASEEQWHNQTPCELWEVRDMAGHLLDAAYGYLGYFKQGEQGWPTEQPRGMRAYGDALGISALEYRKVYRWEVLGRLEACASLLFDYFDQLTEEQWTAGPIPHAWVGPVPGFMMAAFQLMDYSVHNWDLRKALGKPAYVEAEASDTLVPFMFGLMEITFAPERAKDLNLTVGIHISTSQDEHWTVRIKDGVLTYKPGKPKKPDADFSYPCTEFCLDVYQRTQGGTAFGSKKAAKQFRKLFFTI
ncbi:maleylpyruvate isomerase family mycothiol-dependent enzyme [Nocardia jiangxiensis]|uniref:Maleylpyruvate isomerase family mycothiol-dependent enzyme n=1 Tax=Nocardia jiangxiensis TaxID=282685 RepID=A0ABW6RZ36_9NOCA